MAGHDLLDKRKADACALPARFGGKEWFQHATGVRMGYARAIVYDSKDQASVSIPGLRRHHDRAPAGAGIAGVEEEVHDRMLEQAGIAVDDRKIGRHVGMQIDIGLCKPMLDERNRPRDKGRGLNPFGSRPITSGQS